MVEPRKWKDFPVSTGVSLRVMGTGGKTLKYFIRL